MENTRLRLGVIGVVVVSLFAALLARLWYLQVIAAPTYKVQAEGNAVKLVAEEAPRGRIVDRQGRVIVDNKLSNAVVVTRSQFVKKGDELDRLSQAVNVPVDELRKRIDDPRFSPYSRITVADNVPKEMLLYVREHASEFPGVEGVQVTERTYPKTNLAAHVVGYVGEINGRELKARKNKGYREGDLIGKSGIEQVYEDDLRGKPGLHKLEVDSKGRVLRSLGYQPPVQGHDVKSTLDMDIQYLTEESLAQGITAARGAWDRGSAGHFTAPGGAAVVMDPRDGSVLAMASNPTYDPSAFVNGIKPEAFKVLQDPLSGFPLTNRAIQGQYAPGSTFKLVTAIAALSRGIISPDDVVVDGGAIKIGTQLFRNAQGRAWGPVNMPRALTVSSDVYFYKLGNEFWNQRGAMGDAIQETARNLGLGDRTNVPLPYEAIGRIPDPETRRRLHDSHPQAFPNGKWYAGDNVNLAIGQGETVVTPMELTNAYATFANGGTVFQPRVVDSVSDVDGNKLRDAAPRILRRVDLPPSVRDPILEGLLGVTSSGVGTAAPAFSGFPLATFPVAGKTGTAQVTGKQDTSLFCAFGPASDPQYTVCVVMEESGFGASAAAPVARRILESLAGKPPRPVAVAAGAD